MLDHRYAEYEVLRLAARAETASEHPLAAAIMRGAQQRGLPVEVVDHADPVVGRGIVACVEGHDIAVGSAELLDADPRSPEMARLNREGRPAMYVGVDG